MIPENTRAIWRYWDVSCDLKGVKAYLHFCEQKCTTVHRNTVFARVIEKKDKARITDDKVFNVYEEMMRKMVAYKGPCACGKARVFQDGLCHECFLHKIPETHKAAANSRKRQRE